MTPEYASFYSEEEIGAIGFRHVGRNVKISRKASIFNAQHIAVGDHSRIDDFCVLSAGDGGIHIGNQVHLAVFSSLIGGATIRICDFANLSSRVSIYSSSDDFSGTFMTNPTVPAEFTRVYSAPVVIGKHVILGTGSVVLPGVTIGDGAAIGALTLIRENCEAFCIYVGTPARKSGERSRNLLALESQLIKLQNVRR